ncbi:MAG: adenylate kinase [Candidatus Krumholzibacteria bacterium]|nr:adenylate kinase [Candidatus Krumholzibacteria bacterium]
MNLVVLGAPGSGKGTQAAILSQRFDIKHVSSGDLLRDSVAREDELGKEIEGIIATGKLVPDILVLRLVREAILEEGGGKWDGWILDGYPRTAEQAEALEEVLSSARVVIDAVIFLDVDSDEVVTRLSSRRICSSCQSVYNTLNHPPKHEGKCDKCGGELVQRSDDQPETIRRRLKVYNEETVPVLDFYELRYDVYRVDGSKPIADITDEIAGLVGL